MANVAANRKVVGTFEDRFISALNYFCDGQDIAVLNRDLRDRLGWKDDRFDKTRSDLIKKKIIKASPGERGKTRFVEFKSVIIKKKSLSAFISYSHFDESFKDAFLKHMTPIERGGLISNWHDRAIKPGDNFADIIERKINEVDIIFLLISIDFINSKYCYEVELRRAMERHREGEARVIPIILRDCLWTHAPFGGVQALPKDGKAVSSWPNQDAAFADIARAVHDLAEKLLTV